MSVIGVVRTHEEWAALQLEIRRSLNQADEVIARVKADLIVRGQQVPPPRALTDVIDDEAAALIEGWERIARLYAGG